MLVKPLTFLLTTHNDFQISFNDEHNIVFKSKDYKRIKIYEYENPHQKDSILET